jgi:hypothetical protein
MFQFGNETEESVSPVQQISEDVKSCCITSSFFSHRPPKKLKLKYKTQAENSRKKLNLREAFSSF